MKKTALISDWLTIGTAGLTRTVDDFVITEEHLNSIVEDYDPELAHCAIINIEHLYGNLGTVREVRLSTDAKGRKILQARVAPNDYYIERNKNGYGLFFSMEIDQNYMNTHKAYLIGLASTDNPASPGTSEVHFSSVNNSKVCLSAFTDEPQTLSFKEPEKNDAVNMFKTFFTEGMKFFSTNNNKNNLQETEEMGMTAEETKKFEEQGEQITELSSSVKALTESLKQFSVDPNKADDKDAEADKEKDTGKGAETDDSKVDLSALNENVETLTASVADLKKSFTELSATPGASTTVDLNTGEEQGLIVC